MFFQKCIFLNIYPRQLLTLSKSDGTSQIFHSAYMKTLHQSGARTLKIELSWYPPSFWMKSSSSCERNAARCPPGSLLHAASASPEIQRNVMDTKTSSVVQSVVLWAIKYICKIK